MRTQEGLSHEAGYTSDIQGVQNSLYTFFFQFDSLGIAGFSVYHFPGHGSPIHTGVVLQNCCCLTRSFSVPTKNCRK